MKICILRVKMQIMNYSEFSQRKQELAMVCSYWSLTYYWSRGQNNKVEWAGIPQVASFRCLDSTGTLDASTQFWINSVLFIGLKKKNPSNQTDPGAGIGLKSQGNKNHTDSNSEPFQIRNNEKQKHSRNLFPGLHGRDRLTFNSTD